MDKLVVIDYVVFNVVVSFMININWQFYSGEVMMSYFIQMIGLVVQNFVFVFVGMCVLVVLIRGLVCKWVSMFGNFWVDFVCIVLCIMFLLLFVVVILLVSQGVIQNLYGFIVVNMLEGVFQFILGGLVVSQVVIKQFGINGGGFFNVNFVYLFENYMLIGNFVENWVIQIILFVLCFVFGKMVYDCCQGWVVLVIMGIIWIGMLVVVMLFEVKGNLWLDVLGVIQQMMVDQFGGNLEGKEVCFGVGVFGLWVVLMIGIFNGLVNLMYDSYILLGGMVLLVYMMFGEVSLGGIGVGLNGLLVMVILVVFIVGFMVGWILEYFGKKIQVIEMKLVMFYILVMFIVLLSFVVVLVLIFFVLVLWNNFGLYGFLEILYVYMLGVNNNGLVFVGLIVFIWLYDIMIGVVMLIGRFFLIILVLVIVGFLVCKGMMLVIVVIFLMYKLFFVGLVIGVVLIVGGLMFFFVLVLGLIVEQLLIQ